MLVSWFQAARRGDDISHVDRSDLYYVAEQAYYF